MTLGVVSKTCFAEDIYHLYLLKVRDEELMLPKVSSRNLIQTPLRLVGVKLSSMSENIIRELEVSQLATEILKSCSFSGSFCWLEVVASFIQLDGIFKSWCRTLKFDLGVDL
jgi:hypothetical protein